MAKGGVLTEAVRRRPYSVILLDEMEKAHPGVQDIFFQVFDKGNMKDGEGRDIDFKNAVIIMTSNAGTDLITQLFADPETRTGRGRPGRGADAGIDEGTSSRPSWDVSRWCRTSRCRRTSSRRSSELQLNRIRRRVQEAYGAKFVWDNSVVQTIADRCTETSSGARNVEKILSRTLLPELSGEVLSRLAEGGTIDAITVGVDTAGSFQYHIG